MLSYLRPINHNSNNSDSKHIKITLPVSLLSCYLAVILKGMWLNVSLESQRGREEENCEIKMVKIILETSVGVHSGERSSI